MKKRILGLALCAAMLLSMLPAPVFADAAPDVTGSSGTVSYVISDTDADGTLDTITYSGTGTLGTGAGQSLLRWSNAGVHNVVIGGTISGIDPSAFYSCANIVQVTLPETLVSIGKSAFDSCRSLAGIVIPDSVTSIGSSAFKDCRALASVTLPALLTGIPGSMFYGCSALSGISIPSSVISIGESAFYNCSDLTTVTIPSGVSAIESKSFYGCSKLSGIVLPDSITSIGDSAFYGCSRLSAITLSPVLSSLGQDAFRGCSSLTSISIPGNQTTIGNSAFKNCTSLSSVTIDDGVISIDAEAFYDCHGVSTLIIPDSVTFIGQNAFLYVPKIYYWGSYGSASDKWGATSRGAVYSIAYHSNTTQATVTKAVPATAASVETTVESTCLGFSLTGNTFIGWNTASDGNGTAYAPGAPITISGNTALYAQWQLCSTSITLNGGYEGSTNGSVSITYGNSAFDTPGDFTAHSRSDYTLLGYYTSAGGDTRVLYPDGSLVSGVSGYTDADGHWCYEGGTLTLYAHWINNQSFEITIPATLSIGESGTGDFALTCHSINGCTVTVTVASAGSWTLQSAVNTPLPYSLSTANNTVLTNGGTAAVFSAAGSVQLHAAITGAAPTYADSFSDTLTFTCSVSAS